MNFSILDPNVNDTMNGFLVLANIINLVYNVPQILKTCKTKSTKDFSGWFLSLRMVGNLIWVAYAIEVQSLLMLINNIVTVVSSGIIASFMVNDMYKAYKMKKYNILNDPEDIIDKEIKYPISVISMEHNQKNKQNYDSDEEMTQIDLT
jgi:uncharacterized protein with PQ loop repeat